MAVNIIVDTTQAQTNVTALEKKILRVGTAATEAGRKAKKALNFGAFTRSQIKEMNDGIKALRAFQNSLSSLATAEVKAQKAGVDLAQATESQTQKLNKETAAGKKATQAINERTAALRQLARAKKQTSSIPSFGGKDGVPRVWQDVEEQKRGAAAKVALEKKTNAELKALRTKHLAEMKALHAEALRINRGVDSGRISTGTAALAMSYEKMVRYQRAAGQSTKELNTHFRAGAQATAAMRGALQGANLGLGIFTSSTVVAGAGAYGIARALTAVVNTGKEFEFSFNRASALLGTLTADADGAGTSLNYMGQVLKSEVLDIAQSTQFSVTETSEAVRELAQAGLSAGEVISSLRPILNTATVGVMDVAEAAKITINIMEQFGLQVSDVARIGDVLAQAANISTTDVKKLGTAMSYAGSVAHQTGISLEGTATALALLAQAGLSGSKGGTSLRRIATILVEASDASTQAGKEFARFGIEVAKTADGGLDLQQTFVNLQKALSNTGPMERNNFLMKTFGLYGMAGASALLEFSRQVGGGTSKWQEFTSAIEASKGANERLASLIKNNLNVALKELRGTLEVISVKAFDVFGDDLTAQIRNFTQYLRENSDEIAKSLASLISSLAAIAEFLVRNGKYLDDLLVAWVAMKGAKGILGGLGKEAADASGEIAGMAVGAGVAKKGLGGLLATAFSAKNIIAGLFVLVAGGAYMAWSRMTEEAEESAKGLARVGKATEDATLALQNMKGMTSGAAGVVSHELEEGLAAVEARLDSLKAKRDELAKTPTTYKQVGGELYSVSNQPAVDNMTAGIEALTAKAEYLKLTLELTAGVQQGMLNSDYAQALGTLVQGAYNVAEGFGLAGTNLANFFQQYRDYIDAVNMGPPSSAAKSPAQQAAEDAEAYAKTQAALAEAKRAQQEFASGFKPVLEGFSGVTGAAVNLRVRLAELTEMQAKVSSGNAASSAVLKEFGVSAKEAMASIASERQAAIIEAVSNALGEMNPKYKDLGAAIAQLNGVSSTREQLEQAMERVLTQGNVSLEERRIALERLKPAMDAINDGTFELTKKMDDFNQNTQQAWKEFSGVTAAQGRVESFGEAFAKASPKVQSLTRQSADMETVMKSLGGDFMQTQNRAVGFSEAVDALNRLVAEGTKLPFAYGDALRYMFEATSEGKVLKDIEKLNAEMSYITKGGTAGMEYFNELWDLTGGNIGAASDELKKFVAQKAYIQSMRDALLDLYSGLEDVLYNLFSGTYKSAKEAFADIKKLFLKFLADMVMAAIRNRIILNISGQASGGGFSWGGLVSSFFGGGGGGGGMMSAAANALLSSGGGGGGGGGGGMGGYSSLLSGSPSGWTQAGQNLWNGFSTMSATSNSTIFGTYTGAQSSIAPWSTGASPWSTGSAGAVGPGSYSYTPSTFGYVAAGAAGAYAGYQRWQGSNKDLGGAAGAAAYGIGTYGAAVGVGAAMTGGVAAGLAAVPIVGWIALALMAIDMISGGKLFGTGFRTKGSTTRLITSANGAGAEFTLQQERQRALFGGLARRDVSKPATPEMVRAAEQFQNSIERIMADAARQIAVETPPMIDSALEVVNKYTKKGKVKSTQYFVEVLGRRWEETSEELARTRIGAEAVIATVAASEYGKGASLIAERWRSSAEQLAEGANFLLLATKDMAKGKGLLSHGVQEILKPAVNSLAKVIAETVTTSVIKPYESVLGGTGAEGRIGDNGEPSDRGGRRGLPDAQNLAEVNTELGRITALVEDLALEGEGLVQTYQRLLAEVTSLQTASDLMRVTLNLSGEEFVRFADDIALAAGGAEQAQQLWGSFFENFYGAAEVAANQYSELQADLSSQLSTLGLDAGISMDEFRQRFESVFSSLSADEVVQWLQAAKAMSDLIKMGDPAVLFMQGIHDQLAQMVGGSAKNYIAALAEIERQEKLNIRTAESLALSTRDLADIQRLAAMQTRATLISLRGDIAGLIAQLFGGNASDEAQDAQDSYFNSAIDHTNDLAQAEQERYQAAQSAIDQITQLLNELQTGDLSTNDYAGRLQAAQDQFQALWERAMQGDAEAMGQLAQYAQQYLQQAQDAYGNNATYAGIFDTVQGMLQQALAYFETIPNPGNGGGGYSGSSDLGTSGNPMSVTLDELAQQELARELASYIGQLALATEQNVFDLMGELGVGLNQLAGAFGINFANLSSEMIPLLGDLAYLLGVPVMDMLTRMGASSSAIAAAANLDLSTFNENLMSQLLQLSTDLGAGFFELISFLGIPLSSVAEQFGIDLETFSGATMQGFSTLAETLHMSVLDVITAMGTDMTRLLGANGIDLSTLDANNFTNFTAFATSIGTDIVTLWTTLGQEITDLGALLVSTLQTQLAALPGISQETVAGLGPYLEDLTAAQTSEEIQQALQAIGEFIETLPEDQGTLLTSLFTDVFGPNSLFADMSQDLQQGNDYQAEISNNTSELVSVTNEVNDGIRDSKARLDDLWETALSSNDYLAEIAASSSQSASNTEAVNFGEQATQALAEVGGSVAEAMAAALAATENIGATQGSTMESTAASAEAMVQTIVELNQKVSALNEQVKALTEVTSEKLSDVAATNKVTARESSKSRKIQQRQSKNRGFKK